VTVAARLHILSIGACYLPGMLSLGDGLAASLSILTRTCEAARLKQFEQEAPRVLALWNQTHDWSRREQVFGAKNGYARARS
jgi:hypothetical protein